jgi:hypothetical protein
VDVHIEAGGVAVAVCCYHPESSRAIIHSLIKPEEVKVVQSTAAMDRTHIIKNVKGN